MKALKFVGKLLGAITSPLWMPPLVLWECAIWPAIEEWFE